MVSVASGVFFASGIGVVTAGGFGSGDPVWIASGQVHILSGQVTVASGIGVLVSGQQTAFSGHGAMYPFNNQRDDDEIIHSGFSETIITLPYIYDPTYSQTWKQWTGKVAVASGLIGIVSGTVDATVQSGVFVASGLGTLLGDAMLSGNWYGYEDNYFYSAGGLRCVTFGLCDTGGVWTALQTTSDGKLLVIPDIHAVTLAGTRVSGAVQVSGTVAVSGLVGVQSGEVHVVSGYVDILTPTAVSINNSGNPLLLDDRSGGIPLWSGAIKSVVVKAPSSNSGDVYVGGYGAGQMPYSGQGLPLAAGEAVVIDIVELGYIKCMATISGFNRVAYLGIN